MNDEALRTENEALLQFIYLCPVGVIRANMDGGIQQLNPRAIQLLSPLVTGGWIQNLFTWLSEQDPEVLTLLSDYTEPSGMVFEGRRLRPTHQTPGASEMLELTMMKVDAENLMVVIRDATELARREAELERLARTDPLTGAYNRRYFLERFSELADSGAALSLMMIDIDWFKSVNDTYGHDAGDAVLCALVDVIRQNTRSSQLLARLGGEEFALLLNDITLSDAIGFAERIRSVVEDLEVIHNDHSIRVTVSVGVAESRSRSEALPSLLKAADEALYAAKDGGRNQICVAGSSRDKETQLAS